MLTNTFGTLKVRSTIQEKLLAVRQGFEPWRRCRLHAFQACAFDHSATSPVRSGGI